MNSLLILLPPLLKCLGLCFTRLETKMSGHIGERNRKGTLPRLVVTRSEEMVGVSMRLVWAGVYWHRILFGTITYKGKLPLGPRDNSCD